jgi:hypothetical protein
MNAGASVIRSRTRGSSGRSRPVGGFARCDVRQKGLHAVRSGDADESSMLELSPPSGCADPPATQRADVTASRLAGADQSPPYRACWAVAGERNPGAVGIRLLAGDAVPRPTADCYTFL